MIFLNKKTPVQSYFIGTNCVDVYREDMCGGKGAPPFSKIRGLVPYLISLKEKGKKYIGYTETSISMAGWGVSWACLHLGLNAVIFNPVLFWNIGREVN